MTSVPELVPLISQEQIQKQVCKVADQINIDYCGHQLVLIGLLKGAFIFLADLARQITIPHQIDFMRAASYGRGTATSGKVSISQTPTIDLKHKDVLLVEDIVDTGITLACVKQYLQSLAPASLRICALIDKIERREVEMPVDYVCFNDAAGFLVGYGLDCNENYRSLPAIYILDQ